MEVENTQKTNQQNQDTPFVGINGENTGLGFSQRDQYGKSEEEQGILDFRVIKNDKTSENCRRLIDLKNIFSRQLPKMPKEYIVKLVFDRNHEAMVIIKNDKKVIGGICYRRYPTQRFAEIAFLAVTAQEQVKGYGTRLMNKFKEQMQKQDIEYLLTYADNFAIGYFKKQGFTKEARMPEERWKGFIKDYDGGTQMECYVHPFIDYSNISTLIKRQKQKLSLNHIKFPGIDIEQMAKQKGDQMKNEDEPLIDPMEIPGVKQSGWQPSDLQELKKQQEKSFNLQCQNIIDLMRRHKQGWPFMEPVNKEDVADYYDVISDPIDLKTVEQKLVSNIYQDKDSFIADINRIFNNCRKYNQPDTIYYKAANDLEEYITPHLNTLKDNQNQEGKNQQKQQKKSKKGQKQ
ncbi:Bromodomain [Pseudocohnilembus persalinus]|uniref:histone acetyltransferase n=1 Tax=Pseudocohnilembus persalinus TaxID=266149 RepID=A0A0V0R0T9_PSEPJ|nr:Bromodomain [Pseudocohnilembus persalinus]|eukprot:KRX08151.1 Bromodomain [Pseudocohnilembus persalinus]